MNITVAGMGYVGLANAVLLSQHYAVTAYDISAEKLKMLNNRISPIRDAEIEDFLQNKKLNLTTECDKEKAYCNADFIIIATPTNYDSDKDSFDTSSVEAVIKDAAHYAPGAAIVIKSTVPAGFTEKMNALYQENEIIFSPEFLREGKALYDNLYPSRIIIGGTSESAKTFGTLLLKGAAKKDTPVLYMRPTEAEAVKLFANTFLALRIAYFNELDTYSELRGLDTASIIKGVCLDPRIGDYYNNPSFGYGGYCLPKDTKQLRANYRDIPNSLIGAIVEANTTRKDHIAAQIITRHPKTVGVYGLAMKTDSDNFRFSAVFSVINRLKTAGIKVIVYDKSVKEDEVCQCHVERNLSTFKAASDVIIANRMNENLWDVQNKVYTRDLFARD